MKIKFALGLSLSILSACASSKSSTAEAASRSQPEVSANVCSDGVGDAVTQREELCRLVNQARAENGLGPLTLESHSSVAAQKHAADMSNNNYFSHESRDGRDAGDRLRTEGLQFNAWGENIAQGQQTPTAVMVSWMNSPGHRANLLSPNYHRLGLGIINHYWVQDFIN